jgi:tRNA threonylcarbamoyladenosine biosynthesis protein TsaE
MPTVKDEAELKVFLQSWLKTISKAQIVLLNGPMGAGKTRFVQLACQLLGAKETSSPSFAIHNEYKVANGCVDHLDLYRIEGEEDLESTGFWDLFEKSEGLIFIEWAEKLGSATFSKKWGVQSVLIEFDGEQPSTCRKLTVEVAS